jgi:hypothetical protein
LENILRVHLPPKPPNFLIFVWTLIVIKKSNLICSIITHALAVNSEHFVIPSPLEFQKNCCSSVPALFNCCGLNIITVYVAKLMMPQELKVVHQTKKSQNEISSLSICHQTLYMCASSTKTLCFSAKKFKPCTLPDKFYGFFQLQSFRSRPYNCLVFLPNR